MKAQTFVLLLGGAILLALTSLIAGPLVLLRSSPQSLTTPPLVQGLPTEFGKADAAFRVRIAEAFLPGSSEAALIQRLQVEGFDKDPTNRPGSGRASRTLLRPAS